jgi:tryptophan synthase alpha chain
MIQSRITRLFEQTKPALVAYITAGDPTPAHTAKLVAALERGGAGLIELGVPFSDPIADGPVIQRGSERALSAGTNVTAVLKIAAEIRKTSQIPLLLFSYVNPLMRYGFEKLAQDAVAAGIDGVLLIDLSVEEAPDLAPMLQKNGLDTVFLAAPTSTERRLKLVAEYSRGFVYLVSRTGVTGEQVSISESVAPLIDKMRSITTLPLAVGFGISTAEQVRAVGKLADGVVVGSGFVRVIEQYGASPDLETKLEAAACALASGLR